MFPAEGVQTSALGHVPDAQELVLAVRQYGLRTRMEQRARHIVVVAATRVYLPGLVDERYK